METEEQPCKANEAGRESLKMTSKVYQSALRRGLGQSGFGGLQDIINGRWTINAWILSSAVSSSWNQATLPCLCGSMSSWPSLTAKTTQVS